MRDTDQHYDPLPLDPGYQVRLARVGRREILFGVRGLYDIEETLDRAKRYEPKRKHREKRKRFMSQFTCPGIRSQTVVCTTHLDPFIPMHASDAHRDTVRPSYRR